MDLPESEFLAGNSIIDDLNSSMDISLKLACSRFTNYPLLDDSSSKIDLNTDTSLDGKCDLSLLIFNLIMVAIDEVSLLCGLAIPENEVETSKFVPLTSLMTSCAELYTTLLSLVTEALKCHPMYMRSTRWFRHYKLSLVRLSQQPLLGYLTKYKQFSDPQLIQAIFFAQLTAVRSISNMLQHMEEIGDIAAKEKDIANSLLLDPYNAVNDSMSMHVLGELSGDLVRLCTAGVVDLVPTKALDHEFLKAWKGDRESILHHPNAPMHQLLTLLAPACFIKSAHSAENVQGAVSVYESVTGVIFTAYPVETSSEGADLKALVDASLCTVRDVQECALSCITYMERQGLIHPSELVTPLLYSLILDEKESIANLKKIFHPQASNYLNKSIIVVRIHSIIHAVTMCNYTLSCLEFTCKMHSYQGNTADWPHLGILESGRPTLAHVEILSHIYQLVETYPNKKSTLKNTIQTILDLDIESTSSTGFTIPSSYKGLPLSHAQGYIDAFAKDLYSDSAGVDELDQSVSARLDAIHTSTEHENIVFLPHPSLLLTAYIAIWCCQFICSCPLTTESEAVELMQYIKQAMSKMSQDIMTESSVHGLMVHSIKRICLLQLFRVINESYEIPTHDESYVVPKVEPKIWNVGDMDPISCKYALRLEDIEPIISCEYALRFTEINPKVEQSAMGLIRLYVDEKASGYLDNYQHKTIQPKRNVGKLSKLRRTIK